MILGGTLKKIVLQFYRFFFNFTYVHCIYIILPFQVFPCTSSPTQTHGLLFNVIVPPMWINQCCSCVHVFTIDQEAPSLGEELQVIHDC